MKNLILLILSITLTGCWGTDQGEGKFYEYTIRNESGKNIEISSYRNIYPERNTAIIIQLKNEEELKKTFQDNLPPSGYNFGVFFNGDSLIINYNNERKQVFTFPTENDRNPFFYTGTDVTYIFTEQDYENAEDCNGNCD